MIKERKETNIEGPVRCPKCKGIADHIKTDYAEAKNGNEMIVDKLYKCQNCESEWIKPINSLV